MKFLLSLLLAVSIIPQPKAVEEKKGVFTLDERTAVVSRCAEFAETAADFRADVAHGEDGDCWRFWDAKPTAEERKNTRWVFE